MLSRSITEAVNGLKAQQTMLDVVGNNIANVNTSGFKKDTVVFEDLLSESLRGAVAPGESSGGTDPVQIGCGARVAAVETIHTSGPLQYSGRGMDMAIDGNGYYVLNDGRDLSYSRAGSFELDSDGAIVQSGNGMHLQGYALTRDPADPTQYVQSDALSNVTVPLGSVMDAKATALAACQGNLDSRERVWLPVGFADLSAATGRKVTMTDGSQYVLTSEGANSAGEYLTLSFNGANPDGTATFSIPFRLTGVRSEGLPALEPSVSNITLPGGAEALVSYDDVSGELWLTGSDGSLLYEMNIHNEMSYAAFSITDSGLDKKYNFIAEFDEGSIGADSVPLTLWYSDENGAIGRALLSVPMEDGAFRGSASLRAGSLPAGYVLGANFTVTPSAQGNSLELAAAGDSTAASALVKLGTVELGGCHSAVVQVYDGAGTPHSFELTFAKVAGDRWRWTLSSADDERITPLPSSGELSFDETGALTSPSSVTVTVPFSQTDGVDQTLALNFGGSQALAVGNVTQLPLASVTDAFQQDGYAAGTLDSFAVATDGTIKGDYGNGQTVPLYRLALAQFVSPSGLAKEGETLFAATVNSGGARIGAAAENGAGTVKGGYLEGSNVSLADELSSLLVAQRGFQANARVLQMNDRLLEDVMKLKDSRP